MRQFIATKKWPRCVVRLKRTSRAASIFFFWATMPWKRWKSLAQVLALRAASFLPHEVAAHWPSISGFVGGIGALLAGTAANVWNDNVGEGEALVGEDLACDPRSRAVAEAPLVVDHVNNHDELASIRAIVDERDATVLHKTCESHFFEASPCYSAL